MTTTNITVSTSLGITLSCSITKSNLPNSKPWLIFLHHWGGASSTSLQFRTLLSSKYHFSTIAPTFRGFGASSVPSNLCSSAYTIRDHANDVKAILQDQQFSQLLVNGLIIMGHSMGAKTALLVASELGFNQGERPLRGLILLCPAPPTPFMLPPAMSEQQIHAYDTPAAAEYVIRNVLSAPGNLKDAEVNILVESAVSGNEDAKRAWPAYGMAEDISSVLGKGDITDPSSRILVLAGEKDVVEAVERVERETVARLPGAQFEIIEGSGHLAYLEKEGEVVKKVGEFVEDLWKTYNIHWWDHPDSD